MGPAIMHLPLLTKFISALTQKRISYISTQNPSEQVSCIDFREDILAFLTGQEEIESTATTLRSVLSASDKPTPRGIVITLYAAQQTSVQQKVFLPTKEGCRKIVLATNIAETSLTIPGVKHVVDSCRVKAK